MTGQFSDLEFEVLDVITTAVAAVDDDGRFVYMNEAYLRMFSAAEPRVGSTIYDAADVGLRWVFVESLAATIADGRTRVFRNASDVLGRVFENTISKRGRFTTIEVRDITEEAVALEQRRQFDAATEITWARTKSDFLMVDVAAGTVSATPGLWRRWPVRQLQEVVAEGRVLDFLDNATTWQDAWLGPESALDGRVERAIGEVFLHGVEQHYRIVVPVEPDDIRHYDVELVPWVVDGVRRGAIMVAHDVSGQLRAEQREAITAASMQQLLSRLPVTLWQIEPEDGLAWPLFPDRREHPDPAWGQAASIPATFAFLSEASIDELMATVQAIAADRQETLTVSTVDEQRWLQMTLSLIENPTDTGTAHVLAVVTDVTDERADAEADSRIDHATHVMRFAQGVAHDFGNVAQVIGGYSELLTRSQDPALVAQASARLQSAAQRAVDVSRRIARIAKVQQVVNGPVDLGALVVEQVDVLRGQFDSNVHLTVTTRPNLIAYAESNQVASAVENLCLNAAEAMNHAGHIHVDVSSVTNRGRGYVEVSVADDGPGIPDDIIDRVFDPFVTGKPTLGTGLGLYLIQEYLYSVGGQVMVENADRGAVFRMRFQAARLGGDGASATASRRAPRTAP